MPLGELKFPENDLFKPNSSSSSSSKEEFNISIPGVQDLFKQNDNLLLMSALGQKSGLQSSFGPSPNQPLAPKMTFDIDPVKAISTLPFMASGIDKVVNFVSPSTATNFINQASIGARSEFINSGALAASSGIETVGPVSKFLNQYPFLKTPQFAAIASALPDLIKGNYKSAAGTGIGTYAGAALFPANPFIGGLVGGFVGKVASKLVGGGTSVGPNMGASLVPNEQGTLYRHSSGSDNGGDVSVVNQFTDLIIAGVNSELNKNADKYLTYTEKPTIYVEILKGKIHIYDESGGKRTFDPKNADQALQYAISTALVSPNLASSAKSKQEQANTDKQIEELISKIPNSDELG